jgi:hypothetical protein
MVFTILSLYKIIVFIKQHGRGDMNFLVCINCDGYYQLEDNEKPDDFESCQCGGKLTYTNDIDHYFEAKSTLDMDNELKRKLGEIHDLEKAYDYHSNKYYNTKEHIGILLSSVYSRLPKK